MGGISSLEGTLGRFCLRIPYGCGTHTFRGNSSEFGISDAYGSALAVDVLPKSYPKGHFSTETFFSKRNFSFFL